MAIICTYFHPTDIALNTHTRLGISRFLSGYRGAYIICGDFNIEPEGMHELGWEVPAYSQYSTPRDTKVTCKIGRGTLIDYAIVSHCVKHGIKSMTVPGTPIATHVAVRHIIRGDLSKIKTLQMIKPAKMRIDPKAGIMDMYDWATATRHAHDLCIHHQRRVCMESQAHASEMGDPIIADELGEEYSLWAATAQIQLLSTVTHEPDHMKKHMGMGAPHRLSMLPVVTKQPPEYMHADQELNVLCHVRNAFQALLYAGSRRHWTTHEHCIKRLGRITIPADISGNGVNTTRLRGWCQYARNLSECQIDGILTRLAKAIEARQKVVGTMEGASYRKWVSDSLEKGAGPAHAWTRQTDKAPPLPEYIQDGDRIHYDPIPKAEYFARMWAGYWAKEWDTYIDTLSAITHIRYLAIDRDLPEIEAPDVWKAAKAIRLDTGLGVTS